MVDSTIVIDPGDLVICDSCDADMTDDPTSGGIMFGSKAICPACTPAWLGDAEKYGEISHVKARCPAGKSFADWIRDDIRGRPRSGALTKTTVHVLPPGVLLGATPLAVRTQHQRMTFPPEGAQVFEHRGIRCACVHVGVPGGQPLPMGPSGESVTGWWNGYVRLPEGHPWIPFHEDALDVEVFGGLTWRCTDQDGATWIGWDGAHPFIPERHTPVDETTWLAEQVRRAASQAGTAPALPAADEGGAHGDQD